MRVTANSIQGHRKYMEDCYKIRFQRESSLFTTKNKKMLSAAASAGYLSNSRSNLLTNPQSDIIFSYFGIFDGHGGQEASQFVKEQLYWKIVESEDFWSNDDKKVLKSIKDGFVKCQQEMMNELPKWPKTASGQPSTSGSTATIIFIKKHKVYVGHVGDSGLVIGYTKGKQPAQSSQPWLAKKLTKDHKPEDPIELKRIQNAGGAVVAKGGVNRVVWNRPILNTSPVRTQPIPFLAVSRSLGDLWSFNDKSNEYLVSPVPDVFHFELDPSVHKCLILATDGLWNTMRVNECTELVRLTDKEMIDQFKTHADPVDKSFVQPFVNPSQRLNNVALKRCTDKIIRSDNSTCITIMLDEPVFLNEDFLADDTVIQSANITGLAPFNKSFNSRVFNDSEYYNENERSRQIFNQTTSTAILDFNTPGQKRSRSLTSLRRRHWSGSSNPTTPSNKSCDKNKFINSADRGLCKKFQLNKFENIASYETISNLNESKRINYARKSLADSSINSNYSGISCISRNIRKSLSDVCSGKKLKKKKSEHFDVISTDKENLPPNKEENNKKSNRLLKRFKSFKDQFIQTKNNLFHKNRNVLKRSENDMNADDCVATGNKLKRNERSFKEYSDENIQVKRPKYD